MLHMSDGGAQIKGKYLIVDTGKLETDVHELKHVHAGIFWTPICWQI